MRILVACEESQRLCIAFRGRGHEAYSCDLVDCSGGHPEWHVKRDVLEIINGAVAFCTCDGITHYVERWDLIIAHPPCTYLSNVGSGWLNGKDGFDEHRYFQGLKARRFFLECLYAKCDKVCVENPTPASIYKLPPYTQAIQPHMFGDPYTKRTCLWLRGLKPLKPDRYIERRFCQTTRDANWYNKGGLNRKSNRSKTFPGIARAMSEQWG